VTSPAWQAKTGFHRRGLIESDTSRYKRIFGRGVRPRYLHGQQAEASIAAAALKRMFDLGQPISRRAG